MENRAIIFVVILGLLLVVAPSVSYAGPGGLAGLGALFKIVFCFYIIVLLLMTFVEVKIYRRFLRYLENNDSMKKSYLVGAIIFSILYIPLIVTPLIAFFDKRERILIPFGVGAIPEIALLICYVEQTGVNKTKFLVHLLAYNVIYLPLFFLAIKRMIE